MPEVYINDTQIWVRAMTDKEKRHRLSVLDDVTREIYFLPYRELRRMSESLCSGLSSNYSIVVSQEQMTKVLADFAADYGYRVTDDGSCS